MARTSLHGSVEGSQIGASFVAYQEPVAIDDYWRTLLVDITEQKGVKFTYKSYHDFCSITRNFANVVSKQEVIEKYVCILEL
jgi:hypothetical protein